MNTNKGDQEETTGIGVIGEIGEDEIVGVEVETKDGKEKGEDSIMAEPGGTVKEGMDKLVHQIKGVDETGMTFSV